HVGLPGGADHRSLRIGPQVQPRVDRDAVPAHGDTGPVDVGVGLGIGCFDDLMHVDAVAGGESGELVRQGDVDVPVGGLGEFGHFGGFGTAQVPHAVAPPQVG